MMNCSIPTDDWAVNADDPLALSQLLSLPELRVTRLEYHPMLDAVIVLCDLLCPVAACPTCGMITAQIHERKERLVRDLALAGRRCYLALPVRRFTCRQCSRPFTERLDAIAHGARYTRRYEQYLFEQCRGSTIQAIHKREGLGYKALEGVYYRLAARQQAAAVPSVVGRLGIDEIALKKGHGQYVLVLSDLERRRVLTVLPDRLKETLEAYFATWCPEQRAAVTAVALDLWEPYHRAVQTCLPQARITADRFHVMQNLTASVSTARRTIQREATKEEKAQLKGCRWLLVKNAADLTGEEEAKLQAMLSASPLIKRLYELKEEFRAIFETTRDRAQAAAALEAWIEEVEQSALPNLQKFVTTLRNWWEVILNYFHDRLTSGFVEGMNNKIKLIKRLAFGYGNFDHFRRRVLVECDGGDHPH